MYAIERSVPSYGFWHRFYELKSFYHYVERCGFSFDSDDNILIQKELDDIKSMGDCLQIKQIDNIIPLLKLYFTRTSVSFPILKHLLSTLYYTEFFFDLKSNIFLRENQENLISLFSNEMQFSNFLQQTIHIFNIAAGTIIRIILGNSINYSEKLLYTIYFVSNLYYTTRNFIREFHTIGEEEWK
jgi:hypothetical protein